MKCVDEVVNVLYAPLHSYGKGLPGVRVVQYTSSEDVCAALRQIRAEIGAPVPPGTGVSDHLEPSEGDPALPSRPPSEDGLDSESDYGQERYTHEHTEDEVKSVRKLETFFESTLLKKRARSMETGHSQLIDNNYRAYYACAERITGLQRQGHRTPLYRKLLLSIAPYLIIILDEVWKAADSERKILTKRGETAEGDKLEEVAQGLDGVLYVNSVYFIYFLSLR